MTWEKGGKKVCWHTFSLYLTWENEDQRINDSKKTGFESFPRNSYLMRWIQGKETNDQHLIQVAGEYFNAKLEKMFNVKH